ncbi:retinol dehydrogenase 14-like [Bacillus rossius redtenbacheri]|uniref:retinol dehydrogenase 14-like n=1 Tax=Bacillus rossius redtenbacheri TaxID=93214 RepID=UPI002FDD0719
MSWQVLASPELLVLAAAALTAVLLVLASALKLYASVGKGKCTSSADMRGKVVVVTGANSGIGKETALELAKRGAKVIMACRNMETAEKAREEIARTSGNQQVVVRQLDLSSMQSVRGFAEALRRSEQRLDVLVHNAGYANTFSKQVTGEGLEVTMATNQHGPFLLTHLLIDLLKSSAPSRIVVVASELYRLAGLDVANLNPVRGLPAYLYYVSKHANIVFALELARRLQNTGVTVNCLHPGMIDSSIWRNVPFPLNLPVKAIAKGFFKTPKEGAQTTIHLAVSEELEGVTGKYFMDCKEHQLSDAVKDPNKGKKFWEESELLVKLKEDDPHI